ncbi:hypothetical protein BBP40_001574 [Aspergillus hancockii]|nr:hypothetical protein BBP40_001574 [Aspergillus hancockii]
MTSSYKFLGKTHAPTPALKPSKRWMEAHFGVHSLWQPIESDLPANLTDVATRSFLTAVGFPAIKLRAIGWDSTHLKTSVGPLDAWDADELYGLRCPDDDSPPVNFAFHLGSVDQWMVMVGGEDGDVAHYDPDGWDHADGYQGLIATSLGRFAGLLWMLSEVVQRLGPIPDEEEEAWKAVMAKLRERMIEYDDCVEEGSKFWDGIFESFE